MATHTAVLRTAPPPATNRRVPLFPAAAAGVAFVLAVVALCGYWFDIDALRRIGQGPAVNPLAALALLAAAFGAFPFENGVRIWQLVTAALVALVCLLVLADNAMGGTFRLTGYIFAQTVETDLAEGRRNVFGAMSALCLLGLSLAQAARARGVIPPAQVLALSVSVLPLVALIGSVYGRTPLTASMPPQMALALLAVAAAILGRDPRQGIVGVVATDRIAGRLARIVLPTAIALPFILDWVILASQRWRVISFETSLALYVGTAIATSTGLLLFTLAQVDRIDRRRRRAEWRLSFEAEHDALTGALNRKSFFAALDAALGQRRPFMLFLLNLDGFAALNEKLGQAAADDVLRFATQRLLGILRPSDLVARLQGDQFAILIPGGSTRLGRELCERVQATLSRPFAIDAERAQLHAVVGVLVTEALDRATTSAECVKAAEDALDAATKSGVKRMDLRTLGRA
jgi:diguanylate cyclase (GGDEF)-like protein